MLLSNTFRAFRHRDYFIFWCGMFLGHTGSLIQTTAQGWLILQLTNSPFYLGLEGLCLGLPRVIFSLVGGAMVDRLNRRSLFLATQCGFITLSLFLAVLNYFDVIQVWHILAVSALTGFFLSFEQPVRQAILHHLVPKQDLVNAVSLYQIIFTGSLLFGPSIGGLLILLIGTTGCFSLQAVGNLIVLSTLFMIRIPEMTSPQRKVSLVKDIFDGLSIAWNTPLFLSLFATLAVVSVCAKPYTQFMPVFARDILLVGAPGLGLLLSAPGVGAIFGGLFIASITRFPKTHYLLLLLGSGLSLSIILFTGSRFFFWSLFLLFLAGAFQTAFLSVITTLFQINSSESTRGRILALYGLINRGLGPMGAFPIGALATLLGVPLTVALGAFLTIAITIYVTVWKGNLHQVAVLGKNIPGTIPEGEA